ncbi:MAG: DMT family transporter [Nevskia sp.]|jgi:drug/metabolite transporter (DMT)-like permease|uniref:DMT family transporter n=1 Tax=Nevskia sp. TaxID=1929292 RepID=UPI0040356E5D
MTPAVTAAPRPARPWLAPLMGLSFVAIWCTGYPAAKIIVGHSGPFTALTLRFACAGLIFALLALVSRVRWPGWREAGHSAVVGCLQLAMQFGGVYGAMRLGASGSFAALVIGSMPLAVSGFAWATGERISRLQWLGLAIGFAGVWLVIGNSLLDAQASGPAIVLLLVGLVGIASGTLYQKRHGSAIDLRAGLAIQNLAATAALLPLAIGVDHFHFDGTPVFWKATAWIVLVNSVGGFALLFLLIRNGAATQVAALFYLVPAVGALMSHFALGEVLTWLEVAGFFVAATGVWLGTRPARAASPPPA